MVQVHSTLSFYGSLSCCLCAAQSDKLPGSSMIVFRTDVDDTSGNKEAKISGWREWEDRAADFLKKYPDVNKYPKDRPEDRPWSFGQDALLERNGAGKFFKGCGIDEAEGGLNANKMAKGFKPNMGFRDGQPCILLKLNKIIDLEPGDIFISIGHLAIN